MCWFVFISSCLSLGLYSLMFLCIVFKRFVLVLDSVLDCVWCIIDFGIWLVCLPGFGLLGLAFLVLVV